jgi:hypothetical protein
MRVQTVNNRIAARFAAQQLEHSTTVMDDDRVCSEVWKSIHGERLYEESEASIATEYPHAVVICEPARVQVWTGIPHIVGRVVQVCEVLSIRQYAAGEGSMWDFSDSFKSMQVALLGVNDTSVMEGDGTPIGNVTQSRYITEVRDIRRDGDYEVVHHGLRYEITFYQVPPG